MIGAHVHIEMDPYTKEWIFQFVHTAISRNIDQLYLLERSFRFEEKRMLLSSFEYDFVTGSIHWIDGCAE